MALHTIKSHGLIFNDFIVKFPHFYQGEVVILSPQELRFLGMQ